MDGINYKKKPRLRNPVLIVAWPGMGEVAFRTASYLVDKLPAEEFASIEAEEFFYHTGSIVQEGIIHIPELPQSTFYFWKNPATKKASAGKKGSPKTEPRDVIVFLSNAQPDLAKADLYSSKVLSVAKAFKVKTVISLAAMPQPIDHTQQPQVWFTATTKELIEELKKKNMHLLPEGQISGMNGLFLGRAHQAGLEGFCLLGDIPFYTIQIENPKTALTMVEVLASILGIEVDTAGLAEQAQQIDEEIDKLLDYLKIGSSEKPGPIGEDEIEKIKKSLGQLTKLPHSVKEKIEELFLQAKSDITKANELKFELDRWNVYKEYEDRFLDMFKKQKGNNN